MHAEMARRGHYGPPSKVSIAVFVALLVPLAPALGRAQGRGPAPADTSRAALAPADSLQVPSRAPTPPGELLRWRPAGAARADSARADTARADTAGAAARPVARAARARAARIDLEAARKEGMTDPVEVLRGRRAVLSAPLPKFGAAQAMLALPDGGGAFRVTGERDLADAATDRAPVFVPSAALLPDLGTTLEAPVGADLELLDFSSLEFPAEPGRLDGPGDALARIVPRSPADPLAMARGRLPRQFRTTLLYRKGDGGELTDGVRFIAPSLLRGVFGSFARHAAGATDAISSDVSSRYHIVAALPRVLARTLAVDARLLQRSIAGPVGGSRADQERAELAIRSQGIFGRRTETWSLTLGRTKRTEVLPPGLGRERWKFPSLVAAGEVAWGDSSGGSFYTSGCAGVSRVSYREGAAPAFDPHRGEARIAAGVRRRVGAGGVGADGGYDWRETERGAWDARVSVWTQVSRASGRLDLESAHERPSWIDRFARPRAIVIETQSQIVTYARSGDPGLTARRLTGGVGFGSWEATPWLTLSGSGSARWVTHDFGWDIARLEGAGTVDVLEIARERGSGWLSHASLAGDLHAGPLTGRVLAWSRFGPGSLSPRAGSPPRRALEADLGARAVFFGGDLPARVGLAAHGVGARQGPLREPGEITWDATLRFDLGSAGVSLVMRNLFDRAVGSTLLDLETGRSVPLPGRALQFGVLWNLLD